jgi:hypothetical protein
VDASAGADASNTTHDASASGDASGSGDDAGVSGPAVASCPGAVPPGVSSSWCSCELFGQWVNGAATFYNDIWGTGPGPQCIWATTTGEFGFVSNHPNTSGIKSYPNISYSPGTVIGSIGGYSSTFGITVPGKGAWESAYDIWVKKGGGTRIEIMLWMYVSGGVQPIASKYGANGAVPDVTNVTVGGHTWNVYYGSNGSNSVVSLIRTANTKQATVDIKAVLDWIIANKGSFTASWTLDQVQFGFEVTSDGAPQSFVVNSFSVSPS